MLKSTFNKGMSSTPGGRPSSRTNFSLAGRGRSQKIEKLFGLNIPVENVVAVLKEKYRVKDPPPLNPHTERLQDRSRYCDFHQNYGHNTEYCYKLKRIIESLKRKGLLAEFMKDEVPREQQSLKGKEKIIDVILNEAPSMAQLKRKIHLLKESYVAPKSLEKEDVISFTKAELAPTSGKKLNPIILDVSMIHLNFQQLLVRRVLVDSGASSNILYYKYFRKKGLGEDMLRSTSMKLEGFTTHKVMTKGIMMLSVTLGAGLAN